GGTVIRETMPSHQRSPDIGQITSHQNRTYAFYRTQTHAGACASGEYAKSQFFKEPFLGTSPTYSGKLAKSVSDFSALNVIDSLKLFQVEQVAPSVRGTRAHCRSVQIESQRMETRLRLNMLIIDRSCLGFNNLSRNMRHKVFRLERCPFRSSL